MPRAAVARPLTDFGLYLSTTQIPLDEAAQALEITRSYASALATGRATPGLRLALRIEDWTQGSVPCRAWLGVVVG